MRSSALCLAILLASCARSHGPGAVPVDTTVSTPGSPHGDAPPAPDGVGVCCPVSNFAGCSPQHEPAGGWADSIEHCEAEATWWDGCPVVHGLDAHGCEVLLDVFPGCAVPCGAVLPPHDAGLGIWCCGDE